MRLDHLLSKERMSRGECVLLLSYRGGSAQGEAKGLAKCSMFLVAMRSGETPVPIPNTKVKTGTADGTALETVWESRWPPD